ncbi:hypothetical protein SS50377_21019 [Spironucleus salmonicida]|uniref:Uncharacterized protein n=1 Tax=Spironucleus salmonicida TaxID=348837 RepID=A0A9P8M0N5_9EUKA|nr:hypothetical protein SS50377_21019 [Spironucleus salmonicida]
MDQQIFTKLQIIQILACSLQLLHNDQVGFYDVTNMAEYIMLQWPKDTLLTEKIITEYIQLQKDTLFTTTIDKELARMFLYLEGYFSVNNIDISKIKDLDIRISYKQQNSQQKIDLLCLSQHQQDQQNIQSKNQTESMYEQNLTVSQYINYSLSDDSMSQLLQKPQLLSEFI